MPDQVEAIAREPLFLGDTGDLPADTRRVLVGLLLGPSIDGTREKRQWAVLLRDERAIQKYLSELFLELVIDREQEVAFTRQVRDADLDPPILLRSKTLSFLESVLVLYLRQKLGQAAVHGGRADVDESEMLEHLRLFEGKENRDRAGFEKRARAAIDKAKNLNLVRELRGGGRFEVSPTLKLLFTAEDIQKLSEIYKRLAAEGAQTIESGSPTGNEDHES